MSRPTGQIEEERERRVCVGGAEIDVTPVERAALSGRPVSKHDACVASPGVSAHGAGMKRPASLPPPVCRTSVPIDAWRIRLPGAQPFAFAGLWDRWTREDDDLVTCTILTTTPHDVVAPVHDRMPVILPADVRGRWLDPDAGADDLKDLLRPYQGIIEGFPVSRRVSSVANDAPDLREPEEASAPE
jgi:hypothetical protein